MQNVNIFDPSTKDSAYRLLELAVHSLFLRHTLVVDSSLPAGHFLFIR
jgi:hypothetical protein